MQRDSVITIVQEIKDMNIVFERLQGSGADWDNEFGFFAEELQELHEEGVLDQSLIGSLDALVDICVFAIGALHKDNMSAVHIADVIEQGTCIDIWSINSPALYQEYCADILTTVLVALQTFVSEKRVVSLFNEVYLSNMSKLKDGQPIPGNLPGKFGKNMETYFKPDLTRHLH